MSILSSLAFRYDRWRKLHDAESLLPPSSAAEREEIAALQRKFRALPVMPLLGLEDTEADWNGAMNRLCELGASADPRAFQRWDVIVARMAHIDSPATSAELAALRTDPEFNTRWQPALTEAAVGMPNPYAGYRASSEVLIQTVHHVMQLERLSRRKVEDWDVIVEFGGGFGGLCRVIHTLGFRGRYLIYDLEPFSILQRYYLGKTGVIGADGRVQVTHDFQTLEKFVASIGAESRAVFWATWSLSETPWPLRERIRPIVKRIGNYCIAFQGEYQEVDNVNYFTRHWIPGASRIERIPHRANDYYMAGSSI